jgi:hypothetical protein
MSIELKIKAKSLAAEARIIRAEEKKLKAKARHAREHQQSDAETGHGYRLNRIYLHRTQDVRAEARATHLARAFMAGRPYVEIEASPRKKPPLVRTSDIVAKYHFMKKADALEALQEWAETR